MKIGNRALFPLNLIDYRLTGYFIDGAGKFYSTRRDPAGAPLTGAPIITMSGKNWRAESMLNSARAHPLWKDHITHEFNARPAQFPRPPEWRGDPANASTDVNDVWIVAKVNADLPFTICFQDGRTASQAEQWAETAAKKEIGTNFVVLKRQKAVCLGAVTWK